MCQNFSGGRCNISNHYNFDMVLAKDPRHSSGFYFDAEAFDNRLRATRKFLLYHLLRMKSDMSLYQSQVTV
jgi:hypothetical protein